MAAASQTSVVIANGANDYVEKINRFVTDIASLLGEIVAARGGSAEIATRLATMQTQLNQAISSTAGLTADVAANGYKITGLGNAVNPSDAVNLTTAQAILSGGGTPSSIAITALNKGTAANQSFITINDSGAIVGSLNTNDITRAKRKANIAFASI
jgi:hypothetical protein